MTAFSSGADATEEIIDIHCGWGTTPFAPGWSDAGKVWDSLQTRGIQTAFLASDLARRFDPAGGNTAVAEAIAQVPQMRGWLVVHPDHPAEANAQMRRYLYGTEFVGVALYADPATGNPVTLRAVQEVMIAYRRFARPLLIDAPSGEAMLHIAEIAREMSSTRIIASGMGGDDWREAVDLAARPLNLHLDISGALCADKITYAMQQMHGTRKLLFASGAPRTDPAAVLGLLDDLALAPEDRARILSNNAQRLFNLTNDDADQGMELRPLSNAPEDTVPGLEMLSPDA